VWADGLLAGGTPGHLDVTLCWFSQAHHGHPPSRAGVLALEEPYRAPGERFLWSDGRRAGTPVSQESLASGVPRLAAPGTGAM
jgi:hypothetical protein